MVDTAARLLANHTPFIDLRSPEEFDRGSVPCASNLPLLNDQERTEVGKTYKHRGRDAAMAIGHKLVQGAVKQQRLDSWREFAHRHPRAQLFCWRGGFRSQIAQTWLAEIGVHLPRVEGGFKALRQHCLDVLTTLPHERGLLILGGRTGSGKTRIIRHYSAHIDLEGLANHRGSAFGAHDTPQPTPVGFENALACALLTVNAPVLLLEDESRTVGRLGVPADLYRAMQAAPLVIVEVSMAARVAHIEDEYVLQPQRLGVAREHLRERFHAALSRIHKRLGGLLAQTLHRAIEEGFAHNEHARWIESLLRNYYDPMYDFQLQRKAHRMAFRGTVAEVHAYLSSATHGDHGREVARQMPSSVR